MGLTHCGKRGNTNTSPQQETSSADTPTSQQGTPPAAADTTVRTNVLDNLTENPRVEELRTLTQGELQYKLSLAKESYLALERDYAVISGIKTEFCKKLEDLRTQCPERETRLVNLNFTNSTNCSGQRVQSLSDNPTIEIELPPQVTGEFKLLVNQEFQSSTFSAGKSKIGFQKLGDANATQNVTLFEIYEMRLVRTQNSKEALPDRSSMQTKIYLGGRRIIDGILLPSDNQNKREQQSEYRVDLSDFLATRKSKRCNVSLAELNQIRTYYRVEMEKKFVKQQLDEK